MRIVTPPEPVFFYNDNTGALHRITAYLVDESGSISVLLDNARTIKNFNETEKADWVFMGKKCPAWIWDAAKRFRKGSDVDNFFWKATMYGVMREESYEDDKPEPLVIHDRRVGDVLTQRTTVALAKLGILTIQQLLDFGFDFSAYSSITGDMTVVAELRGFFAAQGKRLIISRQTNTLGGKAAGRK